MEGEEENDEEEEQKERKNRKKILSDRVDEKPQAKTNARKTPRIQNSSKEIFGR